MSASGFDALTAKLNAKLPESDRLLKQGEYEEYLDIVGEEYPMFKTLYDIGWKCVPLSTDCTARSFVNRSVLLTQIEEKKYMALYVTQKGVYCSITDEFCLSEAVEGSTCFTGSDGDIAVYQLFRWIFFNGEVLCCDDIELPKSQDIVMYLTLSSEQAHMMHRIIDGHVSKVL